MDILELGVNRLFPFLILLLAVLLLHAVGFCLLNLIHLIKKKANWFFIHWFQSLLVGYVYHAECKKEDHQSAERKNFQRRQSLFAITSLPWIFC